MPLRVGVLVVGSLAWDSRRAAWRRRSLQQREAVRVTVPIRYGRRSSTRGNTYTMVFSDESLGLGTGLLFPCSRTYHDFETLRREAVELWKAEDAHAKDERICARTGWGAVGLRARPEFGDHRIVAEWKDRARDALSDAWATRSSLCLDDGGILTFDWPPEIPDGIDLILATTNQASDPANPKEIAQAWLDHAGCGSGWEEYFFRNVELGIRTSDDLRIWAEIEETNPDFIKPKMAATKCYTAAINILQEEAKTPGTTGVISSEGEQRESRYPEHARGAAGPSRD